MSNLNIGLNSVNRGMLSLSQVRKHFGDLQVLSNINLNIRAGEFVAIVGRSGCGKSTLLRLLAGLDEPSGGSLQLGDQPLNEQRHSIRLMFQDDRLLPWKRVIENVGLGLKGDWHERALTALSEVGLSDKGNAWPSQLSGGQRQRVALARALIHRPDILLLDEPLGALDALTRLEMQQLIERLWLQHRFTVILVTHDVPEAVVLADRVLVLEQGQVSLDQRVPLARGRESTATDVGILAGRILRQVLAQPEQTPPHDQQPARLRWAY